MKNIINNTGGLIGYKAIMRNIDSIFADKLEEVRKLALQTGRDMLNDFRAKQGITAVKMKGKKVKGIDEGTNNARMADAVAYANQHSNTVNTTRGGKWINKTARAARGVSVILNADENEISLGLAHAVYYGAYLEYKYGGRYAVIEPLVRQYAPKFIQGVKKIMGVN